MLLMVTHGDAGNVVVVRRAGEVIGCVQTFSPRSRLRYANVVWERIFGEAVGGMAGVLIAKDWRKRGLGLCMCQAAAAHIKRQGATSCFIDWTSDGLAPFYARLGAEVTMRFKKFRKPLPSTA
jgi:predicted N-acetyltransferase YhbS